MTEMLLAQRVLAVHDALQEVPHAFGGAIALAYYAEPRATIDIDVNLFVPVDRFEEVFEPLGRLGVQVEDRSVIELVRRDEQVRVMWNGTPVDLFFSYDAFHEAAGRARRVVPFAGATIPVLAAEHLMVCKVVFNRPKDWIDIQAMLQLDAGLDAAEVLRWVERIVGDEDPRFERIVAILTRR